MYQRQRKYKLYYGDCIEFLSKLPENSIDMVCCDPPYGKTGCKWDVVLPIEILWYYIARIIKQNSAIVIFGIEPFSSSLRMQFIKDYKYDWKYKKRVASNFVNAKYQPMKHIEDIMVFGLNGKKVNYYPVKQLRSKTGQKRIIAGYQSNSKKGGDFLGGINRNCTTQNYDSNWKFPEDIQEFNNYSAGSRGFHPTQKPVPLIEYLIRTYTLEGQTVLDPTMGSGTTGVACQNLNRNFIGIEKERKYFEIAKKRIRGII